MAYFDSAKNRALWEKELAGLRAEKEARANGATKRAKVQNAPVESVPVERASFENTETSFAMPEENVVSPSEVMAESSYEPTNIFYGAEPIRERITFRELLAEEAASIKQIKASTDRTVQRSFTNDIALSAGTEI